MNINSNDMFIVLSRESEFSDNCVINYFETESKLYESLIKLSNIKIKTNQSELEFTYVFPKGSLYPTEYKSFWSERRNKNRRKYDVNRPFYVERKIKNGKTEGKFYDWAEDFDYQLEKWGKDVVILNLNEALSADYVYKRNVLKIWGDKEILFR